MSGVHANCPSCGGQIQFRVDSSFVTICTYCSSAVARSDRGLEDRGKVIDLIDSQSPLDLWLQGRYGEARFEIVGRTQLKHSMGGVWDEWYCAFDSGHWGWLAEAQGRFYMSFRTGSEGVPPFNQLAPGRPVPGLGNGQMVVAELGQAQILGAKGDIPYLLEPGSTYNFADLGGPNGAFGTLDYSDDQPEYYLGKEVSLDEIGIAVSAPAREEAGTQISAQALECPNCRGSLELIAADQCERVACPYCGALSDVSLGKLNILQILDKGKFPDPPLPLGSKGELKGTDYTICGYMVRSTTWEGEVFYWDEYLLYNPREGFRWLVDSDGHWSFVEACNVADVKQLYNAAKYKGLRYRAFDSVTSQVEFILGQFYWKVEPGERVAMRDYTCPPYSLSEEKTASEVNWSRSTYVPKDEIAKAFGVKLPNPASGTVGLNQPYTQAGIYKAFAILLVAAVAVFAMGAARNKGKLVHEQTYSFAPGEQEPVFSEAFTLAGKRNIEFEAYSYVNSAWVYSQFDLINEKTGEVTTFAVPIEHYSGPDWREGSTTSTKILKAVGAGNYTYRLATERDKLSDTMSIRVKIREGVPRPLYLLVLMGLLFVIPFFTFLHHRNFEQKRWSDASASGPLWAQEFES